MVSALYGTVELSEQKVNNDIELDFHSIENGSGPKVSKNVKCYLEFIFLSKSKP